MFETAGMDHRNVVPGFRIGRICHLRIRWMSSTRVALHFEAGYPCPIGFKKQVATMRFSLHGLLGMALVGLAVSAQVAVADELQDLASAAGKKGPIIWFESSQPEHIVKVVAAFNKRYPNIRIQYVRSTGGGGIAARIIQEAEAGAPTASFVIADVQALIPLNQRGLLVSRNWKALGVGPALVATPYAVSATAALSVVLWNKNRVADNQVPNTWEDFLAERWKGKIGVWVRAPTLAALAKSSGEQHMRDYTRKLVALNAMIYSSTYQLAQQIAAGEVDVGIGLYHSAQPVLAAGAPVGLRFLDPTPVNSLYGAVISKGGNPEGAQVLLAWLVSLEGAQAYEAAVGRGNPLVKGTQAAEIVGSRKLAEWSFDESTKLEKLDAEFTQILMTAGKPR